MLYNFGGMFALITHDSHQAQSPQLFKQDFYKYDKHCQNTILFNFKSLININFSQIQEKIICEIMK